MLGNTMLALILAALSLSPAQSATVAAVIYGRPDVASSLVSICRRESRCSGAIGVHKVDAHLDGYRAQVRLGHLHPWCQWHRPRKWTTIGAWGMSSASNWRYLRAVGTRCYQPEMLMIPLVAALVATDKFLAECDGKPRGERSRWCPGRQKGAS